MRRIIFLNTYFQLITAVQLKLTLFKSDYVTVIITDRTNNSGVVCERLKEEKIFDECVYVKTENLRGRKNIESVIDYIDIAIRKRNRFSRYIKNLYSLYYDEMIFYNYDIDMYGVYSILTSKNKNIAVSIMEEGILSYDNIIYKSNCFTAINYISRIFKHTSLIDHLKNFYCFYPELSDSICKAIRIPQISSSDDYLKTTLSRIFNINDTSSYQKYKYILFESSNETDGYDIGESGVFLKIASIVGKDNVLVKKHPRSVTTVYEDNGINVDMNSNTPFEIIQLCSDFSDKIFISTISGSTISINSIVDKKPQIYFVYPLTKYRDFDELIDYINKSRKKIDLLVENGMLGQVGFLSDYSVFIAKN